MSLVSLNQSSHAFIILATDGFWDVFEKQESVRMAAKLLGDCASSQANKDCETIVAEKLFKDAYVRHSTDNIGVLVILV